MLLEFYETELEKKYIEEEKERKLKIRQEQAVRFREAMHIKLENKKNQQREELSKLESILALREAEPERFLNELKALDLDTPKELERSIKKLKVKLGIISKTDLVNQNKRRKQTGTATSRCPTASSRRSSCESNACRSCISRRPNNDSYGKKKRPKRKKK